MHTQIHFKGDTHSFCTWSSAVAWGPPIPSPQQRVAQVRGLCMERVGTTIKKGGARERERESEILTLCKALQREASEWAAISS